MDLNDDQTVPLLDYDRTFLSSSNSNFSIRSLLLGLVIGVLVTLTNTYYGLQIGSGDQMSMVSALLGFFSLRILSRLTKDRITATESVLLVSTATATGCMPLTAGFVGIIPALEYLIGPDDDGPVQLPFVRLILWSIGLCFFGLAFAYGLREYFVVRENLPWPGARATANLVATLHGTSDVQVEYHTSSGPRQTATELEPTADAGGTHRLEERQTLHTDSSLAWNARTRSLLRGAVASCGIFRLVAAIEYAS
ncbi:hypothetical protein PG984_002660 [Apiospora sp. TS-2023a]